MAISDDWQERVAARLDLAYDCLEAQQFEACEEHLNEAFEIADTEGSTEHPMFASILCMAGDLAMTIGEAPSAAHLYKRACSVLEPFGKPALMHLAKAVCGLAATDMARDRIDEARAGFNQALKLLDESDDPAAKLGREAVEEALATLPADLTN